MLQHADDLFDEASCNARLMMTVTRLATIKGCIFIQQLVVG
jgi:hypothetical protein